MLKNTLKNSAIAAAFIFVLRLSIGLIFYPSSVLEIFEYGVWTGVGVYLISLVILFIIAFLILFIGKTIFKSKNSKTI